MQGATAATAFDSLWSCSQALWQLSSGMQGKETSQQVRGQNGHSSFGKDMADVQPAACFQQTGELCV